MPRLSVDLASCFVLALGLAAACSASDPPNTLTVASSSSSAGGAGGGGGQDSASSSSASEAGGFNPSGNGGGGSGPIPCENPGPDEDFDQDGYTINEGDCDDCDPNQNPGAIEAPTKKGDKAFDEDCDGTIDEQEPVVVCDETVAVDEMDPKVAARAVGICKESSGPKDWGLIDAKWVLPDGAAVPSAYASEFHLGHGVLPKFGAVVKVREGARLLALSSGAAREPDTDGHKSPSGFRKGYASGHPVGFPKESPACLGIFTGEPHDGAALEVELRVPTNAHGLAFDFNFFTYEWPNYVCSVFNDFFVALLEPFPAKQLDGNISFDSMGNPISVNNAFLDVCGCPGNPPQPCKAGGKLFNCALGNSELLGTGFGFDAGAFSIDHGATSWLTSQAPVTPSGKKSSVIKLRWGVYDSGDDALDSTTLIDRFRWILKAGVPVATEPVPK
jgi:hypothetical protein